MNWPHRGIKLAEDDNPLDMETAFVKREPDPAVIAQIEALLDDPLTIERMAELHTSLLVRLLAKRLMVTPSMQQRLDTLTGQRNITVAALKRMIYELHGRWYTAICGDHEVTERLDPDVVKLLKAAA